MYGGRLFLSLESLKLLFHSGEDNFLDDLVETIESEGMEGVDSSFILASCYSQV